jgi:drug/metabolite transporter (DMT)-like permease
MIYSYLEPVSAVVIAALVLGESLSVLQAAGGLLTLAGVGLASSEAISVEPPTGHATLSVRGDRAEV